MKWFSQTFETIGSPLDLAVLRLIVPLVVLGTPEFRDMIEYASAPPAMRVVPFGFQTVLSWFPPTAQIATYTKIILFVACLCASAGLFTRISLTCAALFATYGLGLAQLQGTVTHNQHLVWLLALLAASPCADVFSIDAWRKTRNGLPPTSLFANPTRAHSLAMFLAWLLVAVVFFFPGFWKVRTSGFDWMSGDNLRLQMHWKWFQAGAVPFVRLDRFPWICQILSFVAIFFELSFLPLVVYRRTRFVALIGLLGFHAFTHIFLYIRYPSLWMCYVMFVDWRAVLRYAQDKPVSRDDSAPNHSIIPMSVIGACLLAGSVTFGFMGMQRGWPFACYPTFEYKPAATISRLYVELVFDSGRAEELPWPRETSASRRQKQWGISWSLAGITDTPDAKRLAEFVAELENRPDLAPRFLGARMIRVYRASYSVLPEAWGQPPLKKVLLAEWPRPMP